MKLLGKHTDKHLMKIITCFFLLVLKNGFCQVQELQKAQDVRKNYIDPSSNSSKDRLAYDFTQHVNPFIGTGAHGHTFPGAVAPFGMIQLSPDTRYNGWDGCSGYHYSDTLIYGFSHTHLSGTGVEDLCDLLIVPQQGKCNPIPAYKEKTGYGSSFKHENEKASPGYYAVKLNKNNIDVRLTSTQRAGIHEYTFNEEKGKKLIFIDLEHRDELLDSDLKVVNNTTVSGSRRSKSWAKNQRFYFYLETNQEFKFKFYGKNKVCLIFPSKTKTILLKVGISAVDEEGAKKNLFNEIPEFNFEKVKNLTKNRWNSELNRIHFVSKDLNVMKNFYTAQYHCYLTPIVFSDVDGRFRGNDDKIYTDLIHNRYSIFSLWDTYRAAHPLYTLTQRKKTEDFIHSFLGIYKETNELPVWELWGNETDCMIGYHTTSVILDAYRKGIQKFDTKLALEAMIHSSQKNELGKNYFRENEFIGSNQEPESVSKTLEYAYNDWCISEFAKEIGDINTQKLYHNSSLNFVNLFHPDNKFIQAKKGGIWLSGFNPSEVNFNFTEANSWQYSLSTPQHLSLHRKMLGGKDSLESWLDKLFKAESKLEGRQQADITGLIGQYAHGNEPSHHMAYLYNYTNSPYKTHEKIDQILSEMYQPTPEGLSGNEDCGQMSAWYVLSAIGIYPICPGKTTYAFGRPLQDYAGLHLENENIFYFRTFNNSKENKYIQSITLNGRPYSNMFIEHDTILKGGEIIFNMGSKPNANFSYYKTDVPEIYEYPKELIPVPYYTATKENFTDSIITEIKTISIPNLEIKYTIDGSEPMQNSLTYSKPIVFKETTTLKAKSFKNGIENNKVAVSSTFYKIDKNISLELLSNYANQYAASGHSALIDGIKGSNDFRSGAWQGFEGIDANGIIKFDDNRYIKNITFSCLQDIKSWIFMPKSILVEFSYDGINYEKLNLIECNKSTNLEGAFIENFKIPFDKKNVKTIRFTASNLGVCPQGHLGQGEKAWLFLDEIELGY
jgi:predicted alpha-1,2-mannosidase